MIYSTKFETQILFRIVSGCPQMTLEGGIGYGGGCKGGEKTFILSGDR